MATKKRVLEIEEPEELDVVIFRLKGGPATLQKGFDTINNALTRMAPAAGRTIVQRVPQEITVGTNGSADTGAEEVIEDELPVETTPRGEGSAGQRREKSWKFLSDFDMEGNSTPFKDFAGVKGELGTYDKYMVAAYWLHKHGGLAAFSGNHIFTCFRTMGWKSKDDITEPMRRLKKDKSYFEKLERGEWKQTPLGMKAAEAIGNKP
jgi:hypothetical protein